MRYLVFILLFTLFGQNLGAQDITNAGREFWFAFTEMRDNNGPGVTYWLNITSNDTASGTVSIKGVPTQNFSVQPGAITRVNINKNDAYIFGSDTLWDKAIHVSATNDVVVFAVTYQSVRHEASLILPNKALGTRYRAMTHNSEIKNGPKPFWESQFAVIALEDTVEVEITPTANIQNGARMGVKYKDTIPAGHIYLVQADSVVDDLTGSLIESTNGKKFSVYSGNVWSSVSCNPRDGSGAADPLYEAMFPISSWGKSYFVIPTPNVGIDSIRIVADVDTTIILKDGIPVDTLKAGEYHGDTISSVHEYSSNKPIQLALFMMTGGLTTGNNANACLPQAVNTDPSMIILNATEQMFLDSISFFAVNEAKLAANHWVTIVTRTSDTGRMFLDSTKIPHTSFNIIGPNPLYAYTSIKLTNTPANQGYYRLETDSGCGFLAYSMGFGSAVSYGYAAGVSLVDLSAKISYSNAVSGSDTICVDTLVQFNSIIKGIPLSFQWDFGDGTTSTDQNPTHSYKKADNYTITAIVEYSCRIDTIVDTIVVPPPPQIDLGMDTILCPGDTLRFSANTREFKAIWNTGSTDSSLEITTAGTYHVTVSNFCGSDQDTVNVDIQGKVDVNLGRDTGICPNDTLVLTVSKDSSTTLIWDNGTNDTIRKISGKGIYWAEVSNLCGRKRDSIEVDQLAKAPIDAGGTIISCDADTVQLGGNPTAPPKSIISWSPPESLDNPTNPNPISFYTLNRTYFLYVQDSMGCRFIDSAVVKRYSINAEAEEVKCASDSVQLKVVQVDGVPPFTYNWSPDYNLSSSIIARPKAAPDSSFVYTVVVTDSLGCKDSVLVSVPITRSVTAKFSLKVQASCENAVATTNNQSENANVYRWYVDDKQVSTDFNVRIPLEFGVTKQVSLFVSSSDSCTDSSSVVQSVLAFDDYFNGKVPNAFTPDGDGINDIFDVKLGQRLEQCSDLKIYNRWGELMFQSYENSHNWDGRTFAGVPCKSGVYFYVLEVNGTVYKGHVTLVRQ